MTDKQRTVLASLTMSFEFVGYSKAIHRRWAGRGSEVAPRAILHYLIGLGLIEVRTVTWDNWLSDPRTDRTSPFVEARLTLQGADVAKAQS